MNPKISFSFVVIGALMLFQAVVFAQSSAKELHHNINKIESYLYQKPAQGKTDLLLLQTGG